MKKILGVFVFFIITISLNFFAYGQGIQENNEGVKDNELKRLLIVYKENTKNFTAQGEYADEFERLPMTIKNKVKNRKKLTNLNVDILSIDEDENEEKIIEELKKNQSIESIELDVRRDFLSIPNDTKYNLQWGLQNPNINIVKAWELIENSGKNNEVVVAVIDSGINTKHEDLTGRIASGGYNFEDDNSYVEDFNGHGTAVSGVIAAETNNNKGIAGIVGESDVKILPIKIGGWVSQEIEAINYAIEKNVDVINISMGGASYISGEKRAIDKAIDADIVVVASAGNEAEKGNPIEYPASYENVISVGSIDELERVSRFSNYNSYVNLVAPGEDIYTTNNYGRYSYTDGTSFSAPFVSGICALLKSVDKSLSVNEIKDILFSTAMDRGEAGKDDYYGYGIVNPDDALKKLLQNSDTNPPVIGLIGDEEISIEVGANYDDLGAKAVDDIDGDITENIVVVNPVDTSKPGTYIITYNVSDSAGNKAREVIRTVIVMENGEYEDFEKKTNVALEKEWTIKFNMELDSNTVNTSNIYILDNDNIKIDCGISLGSNDKEITLTPKTNYKPAREYSLIISQRVKSINNKGLTKSVRMKFITKTSEE